MTATQSAAAPLNSSRFPLAITSQRCNSVLPGMDFYVAVCAHQQASVQFGLDGAPGASTPSDTDSELLGTIYVVEYRCVNAPIIPTYRAPAAFISYSPLLQRPTSPSNVELILALRTTKAALSPLLKTSGIHAKRTFRSQPAALPIELPRNATAHYTRDGPIRQEANALRCISVLWRGVALWPQPVKPAAHQCCSYRQKPFNADTAPAHPRAGEACPEWFDPTLHPPTANGPAFPSPLQIVHPPMIVPEVPRLSPQPLGLVRSPVCFLLPFLGNPEGVSLIPNRLLPLEPPLRRFCPLSPHEPRRTDQVLLGVIPVHHESLS
jgi:hypothetical protein